MREPATDCLFLLVVIARNSYGDEKLDLRFVESLVEIFLLPRKPEDSHKDSNCLCRICDILHSIFEGNPYRVRSEEKKPHQSPTTSFIPGFRQDKGRAPKSGGESRLDLVQQRFTVRKRQLS
ncbi:hypothetical protein Bca4012_063169 [Brassica carinata]